MGDWVGEWYDGTVTVKVPTTHIMTARCASGTGLAGMRAVPKKQAAGASGSFPLDYEVTKRLAEAKLALAGSAPRSRQAIARDWCPTAVKC